MNSGFDYFVVLAEMRTGSNFLESNLNKLEGVNCHGEAFNPHFIGYPNKPELLDLSQTERDRDPDRLIDAIRNGPGKLNGFRFFHDHDARALDRVLDDERCAKIILTRNPLQSYVSLKIARETGQWKLTNIKRRKQAKARFDPSEFSEYVERLAGFRSRILNRLKASGQVPFCLSYEDLDQLDVLNGLAKWLGTDARLTMLDKTLTRQNPSPLTSKVVNPEEMDQALTQMDWWDSGALPIHEPQRGPAVSQYIAARDTPLLYLPVRGGPNAQVKQWLAELDSAGTDELVSNLNQKQMRHWLRENSDNRKFTVLRHPLARAHSVFCDKILHDGPGAYVSIRNTLRKRFKLPIPPRGPDEEYSRDQHREAFAAFLVFLRQNLAGQTPIRVDGAWCSQAQTIAGFSSFAVPDQILREDEIMTALPDLARKAGHPNPPMPKPTLADTPFALADIYDAELGDLGARAYRRDYLLFGFDDWKPE